MLFARHKRQENFTHPVVKSQPTPATYDTSIVPFSSAVFSHTVFSDDYIRCAEYSANETSLTRASAARINTTSVSLLVHLKYTLLRDTKMSCNSLNTV